jgi:hypothetical protein
VHGNLKSDFILKRGNAVAWNPTIRGTKSEDTVLIGDFGDSNISFPQTSSWPELKYEFDGSTVRRPAILLVDKV